MTRRLVGAFLLVLAGCAGPSGVTGAVTGVPAATVAPVAASSGEPTSPPVAVMAAQQTIDAFNRTAGGPVSTQQEVLVRLISAGQQSVQVRCPTATSTISFDPVYSRLAVAPGWKPTGGTLPGTVYALPTLIRIYRGDRITGTDLTDLHLSIDAGVARLPALCLT